jgi:lysophospholipase L1-like esterase
VAAEVDHANELLQRASAPHGAAVVFVDPNAAFLSPSGQARPGLHLADGLHLTGQGYRLLRGAIEPHSRSILDSGAVLV